MGKRAVVLLSGGMDSAVLLYYMRDRGENITALSVDYGQRHACELEAAEQVAHAVDIPLVQLKLGPALHTLFSGAKSSQVNASVPVPHGHYAAESMRATIVPNRNMLLLSLAGALAESIREADETAIVAYAAHAGDHPIYPDCRPEFYDSCRTTLLAATDNWVTLYAPFGGMTKAEIAKLGHRLGVPFGLTYSCYEGARLHCGKCGTCVERREAFQQADVPDPTGYAS